MTLLNEVLSTSRIDGQSLYHDLDILYLKVLDKAATDRNGEISDRLREGIRDVAASVVLTQEPFSLSALSKLIDLPIPGLQALNSVILESSDGTIRPFHASFEDFIVDEHRCSERAYLVDAAHHHERLARRCLFLMNDALRYDICNLSEPGTPNEKLPDLDSVVQGAVSAELRYACIHWATHLSQAKPPGSCLRDELTTFCKEHLLHWFEVMSLMFRLSSCDEILAASLTW
jgi:hypothetical protein